MPILWGNIAHPIVRDESSSQVEQTLYSLRKVFIHRREEWRLSILWGNIESELGPIDLIFIYQHRFFVAQNHLF